MRIWVSESENHHENLFDLKGVAVRNALSGQQGDMHSFSVHIFTAAVFLGSLLSLFSVAEILAQADTASQDTEYLSELEYVLYDVQASEGNSYGTLYTLDGVQMTERKFIDTKSGTVSGESVTRSKGQELCMPTAECYACAVGIDHVSAHGLLTDCQRILKANASASNRQYAVGDNIVTTIVSSAQEEAYAQLQELNGKCRWSSIVVVGSDGAVLVDAGSNGKAILDYDRSLEEYYKSGASGRMPEPSERLYTYYEFGSCEPECIGSSFKPVTARLLALNEDKLSEEYRLGNMSFEDIPEVTVGAGTEEETLHNYDYTVPDMYPRYISLADAFFHSSNTYFLRHAQNMGIANYLAGLAEQFHLDQEIRTDGHTIPAMPFTAEEAGTDVRNFAEKISYGQEARLTPVRIASLYNYIISGCWYDPFFIAQVREPNQNVIFSANPKEREDYHFDVDMHSDIVINGLNETFQKYTKNSKRFEKYSDSLRYSGRILTKSGTAEKITGKSENHTMALTLLDEKREHVLCTAFIAVDYYDMTIDQSLVYNDAMIDRLMQVLEKLEVF